MTVLVADIGGTHARLAIADYPGGAGVQISYVKKYKVADFGNFDAALAQYLKDCPVEPPPEAVFAVAAPVAGKKVDLTNSQWQINVLELQDQFRFKNVQLINDFAAMGFAAAHLGEEDFRHCFGPRENLSSMDLITVVGPGTGLGVANVYSCDGSWQIKATEGGHIGFSPANAFQRALLDRMSRNYDRVSVERVTGGSAVREILSNLSDIDKFNAETKNNAELWAFMIEAENDLARDLMDRYCEILGNVIGDLALASGANAIVLAGGLANRLQRQLSDGSFQSYFLEKGRFTKVMQNITVKLMIHEWPGLYGAAQSALYNKGRV